MADGKSLSAMTVNGICDQQPMGIGTVLAHLLPTGNRPVIFMIYPTTGFDCLMGASCLSFILAERP